MSKYLRCIGTVVSVAAITLAVALPAQAGERKAEKRGQLSFEGTISAIDFKARTVTVKKKEGTMKFECAENCKFFVKHVKESAKLSNLKVGDKVEVFYTEEGGSLVAHRIAERGSHADHKEKQQNK